MPGHEPHEAFGAYPDALVAQHAPYPAVPVALVTLLECGPDRFEQPLVPPGPVELFEVVVERAACDAHTLQQVVVAQAEQGR